MRRVAKCTYKDSPKTKRAYVTYCYLMFEVFLIILGALSVMVGQSTAFLQAKAHKKFFR